MFCIQQKKGSTIWYYSPIAYPAFRGQEFKGKGALCTGSAGKCKFGRNVSGRAQLYASV